MEADWLIIGIRFALYLDLMLLMGLAAFGLYALHGAERVSGQVVSFRSWLAGAVGMGLLLSAMGLVAMAASMAGVGILDVDRPSVDMLLAGTATGTAWKVRMGALLVAGITALVPTRPALRLWIVTAAAALALGSLAWNGHGAADEGTAGWFHLGADIVHLFAAGIWFGALAALTLLLFRRTANIDQPHLLLSHRALDGFSLVGTIVVAAIVVSGLVNSWLLVGPSHFLSLPATLYGQLLIAKLVLFGAMLGMATVNRFRLTPSLQEAVSSGAHGVAVHRLRISLILETGSAAAILALVAWLGTLAPPGAT